MIRQANAGWHLAELSLGHLSSFDGLAKQVPGVSDTIGLSDFLMPWRGSGCLGWVSRSRERHEKEWRCRIYAAELILGVGLRCPVVLCKNPLLLVAWLGGPLVLIYILVSTGHLHSVKTLSLGRLEAWSVVI